MLPQTTTYMPTKAVITKQTHGHSQVHHSFVLSTRWNYPSHHSYHQSCNRCLHCQSVKRFRASRQGHSSTSFVNRNSSRNRQARLLQPASSPSAAAAPSHTCPRSLLGASSTPQAMCASSSHDSGRAYHSRSRLSCVLLLGLLLCSWQPQHAAARVLGRTPPQLEPVVAAVSSASVSPAQAAATLGQAPVVARPTKPVAVPAAVGAAKQASSTAAGLPVAAAAAQKQKPATGPAASSTTNKAAGTAAIASAKPVTEAAAKPSAAAAAAANSNAHIVQGLPKTIPIPLLLGDSKYSNPQVRLNRVCLCLR